MARFLEDGLPLEGRRASMTVGVFDGVHRGHQALIERVVRHDDRYVPVIITFRRNHKGIRYGKGYAGDILSFRQKIALIKDLGVSLVMVIEFSESFRRLPGWWKPLRRSPAP